MNGTEFDEIKEDSGQFQDILLHSCCGPCSTAVIERLTDNYNIIVYFYNPNITDESEYKKRLNTQIQFIDEYNKKLPQDRRIKFTEGDYDPDEFFRFVEGLEEEPENGDRCTKCFELRMKKTAEIAKANKIPVFATTLSVSPHKNTKKINEIGYSLEKEYNILFLDENFKKKDGFKRSIDMSREYGLYRQNYCGCRFSKR
ncbi:MAG: epoxyqueuosine reductase QueH [Firmicutes bacterium]|nr:epoxyqueuosine reductase QueH [Bacillota bacterium]